jgi:hypothetical protein
MLFGDDAKNAPPRPPRHEGSDGPRRFGGGPRRRF